jgi:hypothetical protein
VSHAGGAGRMTGLRVIEREFGQGTAGRRGPTGLVAFLSSVFSELFNVVV